MLADTGALEDALPSSRLDADFSALRAAKVLVGSFFCLVGSFLCLKGSTPNKVFVAPFFKAILGSFEV
jgi:hypothetical protein